MKCTRCNVLFRMAEDYRDHLPCGPSSEKTPKSIDSHPLLAIIHNEGRLSLEVDRLSEANERLHNLCLFYEELLVSLKEVNTHLREAATPKPLPWWRRMFSWLFSRSSDGGKNAQSPKKLK